MYEGGCYTFVMSALPSLDLAAVTFLAAHRSVFLSYVMIGVSEFGGTPAILGLSIIALLLIIYHRRWGMILIFSFEMAAVAVIRGTIPELIARSRPPIQIAAYQEVGFSFPSGHAIWSLAVYGFFAWVAWRSGRSYTERVTAVTGLSLLILAIGLSRVVLGVHYPSDVLCSWILGSLCLALAISISGRFFAHSLSR